MSLLNGEPSVIGRICVQYGISLTVNLLRDQVFLEEAAVATGSKKSPARKRPAKAKTPAAKSKRSKKTTRQPSPHMPWLEHYPAGIDYRMQLEAQSLPDLFDEAVVTYRDTPCTDFMGAQLTYGEIADMTNRLTAGLLAKGIGRGHRVGLLLPNCPYYIACYFAVLKAGAIVVNFNPLYTVEELADQARDSGVACMITLDLEILFHKGLALLDLGVVQSVVACPFADLLPSIKRILFKLLKSSELADIPDKPRTGEILRWDALVSNDGTFKPAIIKPDVDIALLQYTGGTTGTPKGAMLTHANLTINVKQVLAWSATAGIGQERVMAILPFFHVFAMTTILMFGIATGSAMILMPRFELQKAIRLIRRHRATILPGVPTLFTALLDDKNIRQADLASLKLCISGGAALPHEVRQEFEAFSGCKLVEGYGLTETSPVVTTNPLEGLEKTNSIGQPVPGTIVSIRSLDNPAKQMPLGEAGEICIKGPQVMAGYWNRSAETADAFVGDYFRTGDVGYMDDEGFIYIIDRIKDMINCSGFKVYPRQIEEAIHTHPAVAEVTVIGIPDHYRGEAPKAFIRLKDGRNATAQDILKHLETKISKIEMPEEIEFRAELPKTMVGKLSKKELRSEKPDDAVNK